MAYIEWDAKADPKDRTATVPFHATRTEALRPEIVESGEVPADIAEKYLGSSKMVAPDDPEAKALAEEITKGKTSFEEKARAVYDWIYENVERDNDVVVCYTGNKYAQAATDILKDIGADMTTVYTLEGGAKGVGIPSGRDAQSRRLLSQPAWYHVRLSKRKRFGEVREDRCNYMDFKQLRSFIAVIRYGSFTTAASKLRISQPTVSTHIRQLEEELGTPLVVRNAKRVELTASGYKMYDQAVSMLAMHDKMLQSMRRHESDAIYLGASSIPAGYILPKIIGDFTAVEPESSFVITQDSSQPVLNGMLSGLYDLGFVGMSSREDTLECIPFCSDKVVVVTPNTPKYRAIDRTSRDEIVQLLREERIVMRKAGSGTREVGNRVLEQLELEESDLSVFVHLNDQEASKNLIETGACIAIMSELSVRDRVADGRMLAFDIPGVDSTRQFYILRRKNAPLGRLAELFAGFAAKYADKPE